MFGFNWYESDETPSDDDWLSDQEEFLLNDDLWDMLAYMDFKTAKKMDRARKNRSKETVEVEVHEPKIYEPKPLLDLAAQLAGKHSSCKDLEEHDPPLDDILLKKVSFWSFPQNEEAVKCLARVTCEDEEISAAENLLSDIQECWQVGFMATTYFKIRNVRVSLTFEQQKLTSAVCSDSDHSDSLWCKHILAAVLYRIRNANKVRVHAPMTESLSVLDKNQLQKLIQYAVEEDPAGILGKIFKRYDEIRDVNSSMSETLGAPDPTFCGSSQMDEGSVHSSKVLEKLGRDLENKLRSQMYPKHYSRKKSSPLRKYMDQVIKLARYPDLLPDATALLRKIIDKTIKSRSIAYRNSLAAFCRDLELLTCTYIMHPFLTQETRDILCEMVQQQRALVKTMKMSLSAEGIGENTSFPFLTRALQHEQGVPFLLEADRLTHQSEWPQQLDTVLNCHWKETMDIEPPEAIQVSLHRFEALVKFCGSRRSYGITHNFQQDTTSKSWNVKIARFGFWLLQKLFRMARKNLVLTQYLQKNTKALKAFKDDASRVMVRVLLDQKELKKSKTEAKNEEETPLPGGSGKGRPGRKSTRRGRKRAAQEHEEGLGTPKKLKLDPKAKQKRGKSDEQYRVEETMSETQLNFCILYVTTEIMRVAEMDRKVEDEFSPVMLWFCLMALDMTRYRTCALDISDEDEQPYFNNLESTIEDYLMRTGRSQPKPKAKEILQIFFEALASCKLRMYDNKLPLLLLDILLILQRSWHDWDASSRNTAILQVCSLFLTDSECPFSQYSLPVEGLDAMLETRFLYSGMNSTKRNLPDFNMVSKKYKTIAQNFFYHFNKENQEHIKIMKQTLTHLKSNDTDVRLLLLTIQGMTSNMVKVEGPELNQYMFDIVVETLSKLDPSKHSCSAIQMKIDFQFVWRLVKDIGPSTLKVLSPLWKQMFTTDQMVDVLCSIRQAVQDCDDKELKQEAEALVLNCLSCESLHGKKTGELASFFKFGSSSYETARSTVCANHIHFTHQALLNWAEKEVESAKTITEGAFSLIIKALDCMNRKQESLYHTDNENLVMDIDTLQKFEWLHSQCIGESNTSKVSTEFHSLVQILNFHCTSCPEVILNLLAKVEGSPALSKAAAPLKKHLVRNYFNFFDHWLNHMPVKYCYSPLVARMETAAETCEKYSKDGKAEFVEQVCKELKQIHAQKRKLCGMLDAAFGIKSKFSK